MKDNEKVRVYLFLGHHSHVDDALDAINKIKSSTKHISNENKILLIENSGWAIGYNVNTYLTGNFNEEELKQRFTMIDNMYDKWIKKIENRGKLSGDEINWPTTLYKFGFENGYISLFEKPNYNITKEIFLTPFRTDEELDNLQISRDKFFIENQVLPLLEEHRNKAILIVRGIKHRKFMTDLLKEYNIFNKLIIYDSEKSKIRRKKEIEVRKIKNEKRVQELIKEVEEEISRKKK